MFALLNVCSSYVVVIFSVPCDLRNGEFLFFYIYVHGLVLLVVLAIVSLCILGSTQCGCLACEFIFFVLVGLLFMCIKTIAVFLFVLSKFMRHMRCMIWSAFDVQSNLFVLWLEFNQNLIGSLSVFLLWFRLESTE